MPAPLLTDANARMEQTNSAAQGARPAIAVTALVGQAIAFERVVS